MSKVLKQKISDHIVINKSIMKEAKIGKEIEVIVQDKAIIILPIVKQKSWELMKSFGKDAIDGILENPSENHNQYLYGAKK